jgi:tRNA (guanine10-N2)-dimethyltransferase
MATRGARVTTVLVELSGESLALAYAEAQAACEALGGHGQVPPEGGNILAQVELPSDRVTLLASRLALARRCMVEVARAEAGSLGDWSPRAAGESAAFRRVGRPSSGGGDSAVRAAADRWKAAGGTIDLDAPRHRFWLAPGEPSSTRLLEEVASVDRSEAARRRMSALPFRRPIGLAPRLARAAANLARVRPGDRVVDPFLGTGALLAEAALLGGRVTGVDQEATMVQGALRNFTHLGVEADRLVVGDAGEVEFAGSDGPFDAVLTDPPYGRASTTRGEEAPALVRRVLPRWADRLRPGGYVVVVLPGGPDPLGPGWQRVLSVPVRVHRSLTREFRVYRRSV